MQSAWYGVSSSGNQANVAVDLLWQTFGKEFPAAVGPLGVDRYMDDVDSGAASREEAEEQVRQVGLCLAKGGFKPKFVAHSGEPPPRGGLSGRNNRECPGIIVGHERRSAQSGTQANEPREEGQRSQGTSQGRRELARGIVRCHGLWACDPNDVGF
jgi:hypothetical protein